MFARSLFEITLGAPLFLNPKSPYGKEFLPEEVRHLLSDGVGQKPAQRTVEKDTNVLLGQPLQYPSRMIHSLTQLLAKHRNVKRAFLALMHDPSVDQKPHLIIGIEVDGDFERVMREAGNVAGDTAPDGEPVDLYRVTEGGRALVITSSRKQRLSMNGSRQGGCGHCLVSVKRDGRQTLLLGTYSKNFCQPDRFPPVKDDA
jgi:hypothetical protein